MNLEVQLEGTYNNHWIQLLGRLRSNQKLKHIIKSVIQMPFEHLQAWSTTHIIRKPVPLFDHLHKE